VSNWDRNQKPSARKYHQPTHISCQETWAPDAGVSVKSPIEAEGLDFLLTDRRQVGLVIQKDALSLILSRLEDIDVTDLVKVCDRNRLTPEVATDVEHQMFVWLKFAIPDSRIDAWGLVPGGGIVFSSRSAIDGTFLQAQVGSWNMDSPCGVVLQFGVDSSCFGLQDNAICHLDVSLVSSDGVVLDGMSISFWLREIRDRVVSSHEDLQKSPASFAAAGAIPTAAGAIPTAAVLGRGNTERVEMQRVLLLSGAAEATPRSHSSSIECTSSTSDDDCIAVCSTVSFENVDHECRSGVKGWSVDQVLGFFESCKFPTAGVSAGQVDGNTLVSLWEDSDVEAIFTAPAPDGLGFNKLMFRGRLKREMICLLANDSSACKL